MSWDYDKKEEQKQGANDPIWKYERMLQFGDGEERLPRETLRELLPKLRIPDDRRAFLELLLWNKPF